MKITAFIILLLCANLVYAHQAELSSCMIYEQNGKTILLIRSSVTAFEGEIDYRYQKNAYKTPDAFKQLVVNDFEKNCFVIINGDTIKLINPFIKLGHETTLFAELVNVPKKINQLYISNTLFKDFRNGKCEIILTLKDLPHLQYILSNENKWEVNMKLENDKWIVEEVAIVFYKTTKFKFWSLFLSFAIVIGIAIFLIKKRQATTEKKLYT